MLTVRRIYLYLVAAISLLVVTWSTIGLLRLIISEGIGPGQITGLASWLAAIIVGLPIFLFHWLLAQRLAAGDEDERGAFIRRLFLYSLMGAGAAPILSNIYRLVNNVMLALVGGTTLSYYPYDLTAGEHLAAIVVWSVVWFYLWQQVQADNRLAPPPEANLAIRRFYLLALALAGLVTLTWGATGLLQTLLQFSTGFIWRNPIAYQSAQLLVGGAIWVGHWLLLQQVFWSAQPSEERSVLRKVYLYLVVFAFSLMAVVSASALLKRLIELALGDPLPAEPLLSQLSWQLPVMVVGVIFWAYHWQILRQDAAQAPELPRQAGVRRVYAYLVAAIGLATLVTGIVGLLSLIIEMLTRPVAVGLDYYRDGVALDIALMVVGAPVWLLPWRSLQELAVAGDAASAAGVDERRSTVRKIYLYLFVFLAALAVFGSIGWFVYHVLTALLGADLPEDFLTLVLNGLVIGLLAAAIWLYHWRAIRRDGQLEKLDQARRLADVVVMVIDGEEGRLGQAVLQHLRHDLPGLQLRPVGLTPQAAEVMEAPPFSGPAFEPAQFIIGSWQTFTRSEVAPLVDTSPALKLVIPIGGEGWAWAGIRSHSLDYYARQAAYGVKQVLQGDEITPGREFDLGMAGAIAVGVILFLVVAAGLVGVVSSF